VSATNSTPTRSSPRLVLQFLAPTLAALLGLLAIVVPYVSLMVRRHQISTLGERLLAEARAASEALPWTHGAELDAGCKRLADDLGARITVIAPDGKVLGESTRSSESLENHSDRPEIREALADGSGRSVRHSATVGADMLYTAWRQTRDADMRIVRTSFPLTKVNAKVTRFRRLLLSGIAAGVGVGLFTALLLSRRMLRRIRRLVAFAGRLSRGGDAPYLVPERRDDLGVLESQFGLMARSIASTIAELRVEHERLEAVLRGMVEGVLVTTLAGTVVLMNDRARELLDLPESQRGTGRGLIELIRDPQIPELTRELAAGAPLASRDLELTVGRTLHVNAAQLRESDGRPFGFILVLHDVSELRRLEVIRRDFVANVSHELRTPLTAIKGYAETLLGSAGDDRDTARRFLAVIDRHAERLGRLIDDLLALSDLELGRSPLRLAATPVAPVVDDVLQILAARVGQAQLTVTPRIAPETPAILADSDRLQQVLINLVENAIKYTSPGGRVVVRAEPAGAAHPDMVELAVEDTGIGIPTEDIPRLTERFFRVDKARSRQLGGTGLGLAIVKHIVQAHGGLLTIQSTLGKGTTVRVLLPVAPPEIALAETGA
jgi:two-component system phosphate regulon sensor histidine kinase PhoR